MLEEFVAAADCYTELRKAIAAKILFSARTFASGCYTKNKMETKVWENQDQVLY